MQERKIHPGWIAAVVTFFTLVATAGFRSAPSVLIVPLEDAFGWSRSQISAAVAINVLLFGLVAPFAAALMERFTVRKVVMSALAVVAISSSSTIYISQPWHLWAL
jgi:cyanate permease